MANNLHKKQTYIDKFARRWYCDGARLRQLRFEKRQAKRLLRRIGKKECGNDDK